MATKKLKNSIVISLILIVNVFIGCKDKLKEHTVVVSTETESIADTILKEKGYFFKNKILYVVERKYSENNPNVTTYYIDKNHHKVLEYEDNPVLIKDTIFDINKDGINDFILLYQTTGPVQYHAYLFNKSGLIAKEIETYNYYPTKGKEFIQVINFRSPIVELKKMKWKGVTIDTIEKIYYNWENPVYYKADKYPFKDFGDQDKRYVYDSTVKVNIIKKLPPDYIKAVKKYYPRFEE